MIRITVAMRALNQKMGLQLQLQTTLILVASLALALMSLAGCGTKDDPAPTPVNLKAKATDPKANQAQNDAEEENENSEPSAKDEEKPDHGSQFAYHVRHRRGNVHCTTGRRYAKTRQEYCTLLMNETSNNHCAQDDRKRLFDKHCDGKGFTWAPTEGDKNQGRRLKRPSAKPGTAPPHGMSAEPTKTKEDPKRDDSEDVDDSDEISKPFTTYPEAPVTPNAN